jgi:carotenoid cleavage dioxygenase
LRSPAPSHPNSPGHYIRNGSNPPPVDDDAPYHWFLSDGMVHGVELRGGRAVVYRNRWVRTEPLARKLPLPAAGGAEEVGLVDNAANTSVVQHAGRILALCETGLPYQLTRELDTVGRYDFAGKLTTPMNARPGIDPDTGEMFFSPVSPLRRTPCSSTSVPTERGLWS